MTGTAVIGLDEMVSDILARPLAPGLWVTFLGHRSPAQIKAAVAIGAPEAGPTEVLAQSREAIVLCVRYTQVSDATVARPVPHLRAGMLGLRRADAAHRRASGSTRVNAFLAAFLHRSPL